MHTGFNGTDTNEVHRQAILMGAVRVFCTCVQHDVARMLDAGVDGNAENMFRVAVKHQMKHGQGRAISNIVSKIIEHPDNMPVMQDEGERALMLCIMQDYDRARLAAQAGPTQAREYRNTHVVSNVMDMGAQLMPAERTQDATDAFLSHINDSLTEWDAYTPSTPFEHIVHDMVLKTEM